MSTALLGNTIGIPDSIGTCATLALSLSGQAIDPSRLARSWAQTAFYSADLYGRFEFAGSRRPKQLVKVWGLCRAHWLVSLDRRKIRQCHRMSHLKLVPTLLRGNAPGARDFLRMFSCLLDGLKPPSGLPKQPRCQCCQINCGSGDFHMLSNDNMMHRRYCG